MSEATNEATAEGTGKRELDKGFRRNLLIIGGVAGGLLLLVFVIFLMNAGGDKKGQAGGVDVKISAGNGPAAAGATPADEISPAMRQKLMEVQLAEAEAARRQGKPYLPPDQMGRVEPVTHAEGAAAAVDPAAAAAQAEQDAQAAAHAQAQAAAEAARRDRLREAVQRQIATLAAAGDPSSAETQRVSFSSATQNGAQGPSAANGASPAESAGSANTSAAPTGVPIVDALEIVAAQTRSPVDTYKSNYVSASIVGGKLDGAFLTGQVAVTEEGLRAQFTRMRWRGKTYSVNAQWLDEKTAVDVADADIDHRYVQRFVLPVVLAAAGAVAQARAQTGSTVTSVGGVTGTTAVATPAPTRAQAEAAGVAAGMQILSAEAQRAAQKPIQVTLPALSPVGLMFMEPVFAAK